MNKTVSTTADHVAPLNINGLEGRVLRLAAPKNRKREILLLYGSHSSQERMFGLAEAFNKYGAVTLPDWPGFGGMDSLYKIGKKPDVDTMADYLASFVKMRYKRRRFTIIGMSYGFIVATRMLQRYPDIAKNVEFIVSIVGFVHKDDFRINGRDFFLMKLGARILHYRLPYYVARAFIKGPIIRATYNLVADSHAKMKDADAAERQRRIDFEVVLWKCNDLRTYFYTSHTMFHLDLCDKQTTVPVYHVAVANDQYFDNNIVEQHLAIIYPVVNVIPVRIDAHMPTIVADAKDVAPFIPGKLRRILARAPK